MMQAGIVRSIKKISNIFLLKVSQYIQLVSIYILGVYHCGLSLATPSVTGLVCDAAQREILLVPCIGSCSVLNYAFFMSLLPL
jgi:hypothetical protein